MSRFRNGSSDGGGGDDKFSVVTRIQKHLSWDHLHIWTVKLLGNAREHSIVITAIISRLNIENEAHEMRWRTRTKIMWCNKKLRHWKWLPCTLSLSFYTSDISQKTQMKLPFSHDALNCTVKIGNIYSLHNVIYIRFSMYFGRLMPLHIQKLQWKFMQNANEYRKYVNKIEKQMSWKWNQQRIFSDARV